MATRERPGWCRGPTCETWWTGRSEATRRRSTPALARLVGNRCMAIACWILRDASLAEDAVQVSLVRAWRDLRALRDPDRFEAWLHRRSGQSSRA